MKQSEMEYIAARVSAAMQKQGLLGKYKGEKALFCICCVAAGAERAGEPWCATGLAQEYGTYIGSAQIAVLQSIERATRRANLRCSVGEIIDHIVGEVVDK